MLICAPVDDNLCEEIKQYLERARGDHYKSHNTINIICLNHNLITFPLRAEIMCRQYHVQ